jgi:hypothetical protein
LIHNDLCDLDEDRRDRPNRPLASGAISQSAATAVMSALFLGGFCLAIWISPLALTLCFFLLFAILAYNGALKRGVVPGAIAMGLCRGLSLSIGAVAFLSVGELTWGTYPITLALGILWALYIAAVTLLAARETKAQKLGVSRFLPVLPLLLPLPFLIVDAYETMLYHEIGGIRIPNLGLPIWLLAISEAASPIWKLRGIAQPADIQRMIGRLIRNLLLMQTAMLCFCGHYEAGIVFLVLHPIHARLARWFYAS